MNGTPVLFRVKGEASTSFWSFSLSPFLIMSEIVSYTFRISGHLLILHVHQWDNRRCSKDSLPVPAGLVLRSCLTYTSGRANQWTACPFCPCMRQSIEEVSHTKRFHARLGSLPPPEFAEACSLANPPLTVVWSEEFTPNLPARGEHSGHPCNG